MSLEDFINDRIGRYIIVLLVALGLATLSIRKCVDIYGVFHDTPFYQFVVWAVTFYFIFTTCSFDNTIRYLSKLLVNFLFSRPEPICCKQYLCRPPIKTCRTSRNPIEVHVKCIDPECTKCKYIKRAFMNQDFLRDIIAKCPDIYIDVRPVTELYVKCAQTDSNPITSTEPLDKAEQTDSNPITSTEPLDKAEQTDNIPISLNKDDVN
jgi:hypothetical protein